jgi:hypothetical protein
MSDGHVEMQSLTDLRDMRKWSNYATRPDWNFQYPETGSGYENSDPGGWTSGVFAFHRLFTFRDSALGFDSRVRDSAAVRRSDIHGSILTRHIVVALS